MHLNMVEEASGLKNVTVGYPFAKVTWVLVTAVYLNPSRVNTLPYKYLHV